MKGKQTMTDLATTNSDNGDLPDADSWTAEEVIGWGTGKFGGEFGGEFAIASSFGAEDVVLIDMAAALAPRFRVFTLDTDFLFPETYALIERIERRYGISVERTRAEFSP